MQRSKSYAILFLLAAFLVGGALGYTFDHVTRRRGHDQRPSRDGMARELKLTPTQRAQFESIMNNRRAQMRELFKPIRPQLDSLQKIAREMNDSTHEQLKRILTPEQGKKLDEMRERGRRRAAERDSSGSRDRSGPR